MKDDRHDSRAPLFNPGRIVATPGAMDALNDSPMQAAALLDRHMAGDWGDVCDEDSRANTDALRYGNRLVSVYATQSGARLWIITESDRSVTTLLLPDEY
jgi:hypothetical protein